MKRLLYALFLLCAVSVSAVEYAEIRAELAKIKPFSQEDFDLGDKLLAQMKKDGMKKPLLLDRQYLFTEPVLWCSSKMFLTEKRWFDQPLFKSREYYEISSSQYKMPGVAKNLELLRETGIDGFGMFVNLDITNQTADMIGKYSTPDYPLYCMPTLCPDGAYGPLKNQHLDYLAKHPAVFRYQGKPVYSVYGGDSHSPEAIAAFIAEVKKLSGTDCCYLHCVGSLQGVGTDPYHYYMENGGKVPATILLRWFDKISAYLEVSGGVKFGNRLTHRDMRYLDEYYDKVMLPLFCAACAQEKYCGKKLFQFVIMAGYDAYLGNQTLCHDGTKSFRKAFELARKYPVDIILQFEWDETNEDTSIQPMVCRPMAYQRIIKYYTDTMKKIPLAPRKGDDLTLPNLIVSHVRQFVPGSPFEVELLNVPDSPEKVEYTVDLELLGHDGKVFWAQKGFKFDSTKLMEYNPAVPSDVFAQQRCIVPRLTINYKGKTRVIGEGMPFAAIRATTKVDYLYLCTPVRNLMFPEKTDASITQIAKNGMISEYKIAANLNFPGHTLHAFDVVNNSYDIFSYDAKDEYLQSDPDRRSFRFTWQCLNTEKDGSANIKIAQDFELKNAKSGIFFGPAKEPGRRYLINYGALFRQIPWDATISDPGSWASPGHSTYVFSVKKDEIDKALFTVTGTRLTGPNKGKKFTWSVPLKELGKYGIKSKVFEDGLQFGLDTLYRPERQPMPLMTEKVNFQSTILSDIPEGILAFRAISRDGRVWWSKPVAVSADEGKMQTIQVYDKTKGHHAIKVEANRVPKIVYHFEPEKSGDTLTTDAGREFYATLGGFNTISLGFQGESHSYSSVSPVVRRSFDKVGSNNRLTPEWVKMDDGKYALRFDGRPNAFLNFPPGVFPHKNGFTVELEVLPEETDRDQVYFYEEGGSCLNGFRLRTEKGKFAVEFMNRRPHDLKSGFSQKDTRISKLGPVPGKWNLIRFRYDGQAVFLSVNGGEEDVLPFSGITRNLNVSNFAGDGSPGSDGRPRYFKGLLRSFSVIHTATP